ncbi:MAG: hypothetical protein H5T64_02850 [Chloroflexi bacterium]|nr:hypothetical protein [Chloroflexota bacterium]
MTVWPLVRVTRARVLPVPGEVQVQAGQNVSPADVIAETVNSAPAVLIDVAHALGVDEKDVLRLMQIRPGEAVDQSAIIACRPDFGGLYVRRCRSPVKGRFVAQAAGWAIIRPDGEKYICTAGLYGEVMRVIPNYGAIIRADVARVRGVWGTGGEARGPLGVISTRRGDILSPAMIHERHRGCILLVGAGVTREGMEAALAGGVKGIITGSLDAAWLGTGKLPPLPVMITEGWGALPMATPIFNLLCALQGREALLIAVPVDSTHGTEPELLVSHGAGKRADVPREGNESSSTRVRAPVRLTREPYLGLIGWLEGSTTRLSRLDRFGYYQVVDVVLGDGQRITVPTENIEFL